jgi:hypothetical protein
MKVELETHVNALAEKASAAVKSEDAIRFSQAACNLANVMATLHHIETTK